MNREGTPQRRRRNSRIPEFANRQEEAAFWDTHDIADYQDEFKTIRARFNRNLSRGITIRFDSETLAELRARAHQKGIGPTTLARMWILERLRDAGT
jgi:predicted DNA binding CopG/RHH family protein